MCCSSWPYDHIVRRYFTEIYFPTSSPYFRLSKFLRCPLKKNSYVFKVSLTSTFLNLKRVGRKVALVYKWSKGVNINWLEKVKGWNNPVFHKTNKKNTLTAGTWSIPLSYRSLLIVDSWKTCLIPMWLIKKKSTQDL